MRVLVFSLLIVFMLAGIAQAAQSIDFVYYENAEGSLVRADYEKAVDYLFDGDRSMIDVIRTGLQEAVEMNRAIYVKSGEVYVDYSRAMRDGLSFSQAYYNSHYHVDPVLPQKELKYVVKEVDIY